ncbi:LysR family transcriptional regulator [Variovorax ureilyticus]|uniref:LysR family transcriptional regulator n=1 Tax=Variovorax ureilyticus TaxID=1836198 RepID=UPI003D6762FC
MSLDAIELRHLRFFVALAEELSFVRAAARCNVSQPPFSVAIQQLEGHLDVVLVERNSRQVRLTEAGQALHQRAQRLLAQSAESFAVTRRVSEGKSGRLRVGFHASMIFRGLAEAVAALERDEPQVELELVEISSQDQVNALLSGRIDIGFAHSMLVPESLASTTVYSEPFLACLPAAHLLAVEADFVLSMMRNENFIMFSRPASPAYFDRIVSLCVEAGFTPTIRYSVRQWLTVVAMVGRGMGVAIVPECLSRTGMAGVTFRPLPDSAAISTIQCMWLAEQQSPLVARLLDYVRRIGNPTAHAMKHAPAAGGPR